MAATEHEGFITDICTNFRDDAPRLIYADWLQDHGDPKRAEFIRVQIALAKLREEVQRELAKAGAQPPVLCEHTSLFMTCEQCCALREIEQGYLRGITAVRNWAADIFEIFYDLRLSHSPSFRLAGSSVFFSRGFVSQLNLPLAALEKHLHRFVKRHPLEHVIVTNKEPTSVYIDDINDDGRNCYWYDEGKKSPDIYWEYSFHLKTRLWDALKGVKEGPLCYYAFPEDAHLDLSHVLLTNARNYDTREEDHDVRTP